METKPEGFLWFHKGELDADKFAGDIGERIPALYASRGYLDAQVLKDTVVVDPRTRQGARRRHGVRGAALQDRQVRGDGQPALLDRGPAAVLSRSASSRRRVTSAVKGVLRVGRGSTTDGGYFDQSKWDDATRRVSEAYQNEGYIYANVRPVVERRKVGADSVPTVDPPLGSRPKDSRRSSIASTFSATTSRPRLHPQPDLRRAGRRVPPGPR